ncbi:MAG: RHS repeat-associated core domain-containing protein [Nitrospira sp.]
MQQILHQLGASGPTINQAAYTYNGVGNRESLTDQRGVQNFGYDNPDRLTAASHPLLGTAQGFAYDAVGNRTTAGNVTNAGNQLTADATHAYQYDDNGNLTRKTLLATGNYTQYTYDAENRLTKVEDFAAGASTPAFTSTYRYDGLGRRIEKVANGQTKRYIYDGEDILLEYDGSNVLQARYTHGPGIDEPIAVTKGANTFFYHQDGLGSVTDLTDAAGATAKSYSYDAYGNILESPGTVDQPYSYTGREFDAESGLYYYRARYYDPTTGRFLQNDPVGFSGGLNLYRYALGNPASLRDPHGENPAVLVAGAGAGLTLLGGAILSTPAGQEALRQAIRGITAAIAAVAAPCPPEDPCLKLYDKVLELATQFIKKRSALLHDPLNLYNRAYLVNPGGDLTGKGTYLGHVNFVRKSQTGLKNAINAAEAERCEIPEAIKNLLNQDIPTQPLP